MIDLKDDETFNDIHVLIKDVLRMFTDDGAIIDDASLGIMSVMCTYDTEWKDELMGRKNTSNRSTC